MNNTRSLLVLPLLTLSLLAKQPALADLISPHITAADEFEEPVSPNTDYYGSGVGGRAAEASTLRFEGERLADDGHYEEAIKKLSKAVQLDPGDGTTHVLYARAMSGRLKNQVRTTGSIKQEDLMAVLREWKMILRHDADAIDQSEAKAELRTLAKVQKRLKEGEIAPESNRLATHYHSL